MSGYGGTSSGGGGGGTITGGGTFDRVAKFTGATAIGDSNILDNGTSVIALASFAVTPVLISRGAVAQTGALFQVQDSVSNVLSAFLADGSLVINTTTLAAAEKLRVFGQVFVDSEIFGALSFKLTNFYSMQNLFIESDNGDSAAVSGAATGRIRYNNVTGIWEASTQGSAYAALAGGGSVGPGTTDYVSKFTTATTIGDSIIYSTGTFVGVNATIPAGTETFRVLGDALVSALYIGGSGAYLQLDAPLLLPVGPVSTARIKYNSGTTTLQVSLNAGAYVDILTGPGSTLPLSTKTANYTLTDADYTILANAPAATPLTMTLPTAVGRTGKIFVIKKINSLGVDTITVDASGVETIDGALTYVLIPQWESIMVQSNGANWFVI